MVRKNMMDLQCSTCKKYKNKDFFDKNKKNKTGHAHVCKECRKIARHIFYLENKENILSETLKYKKTHKAQIKVRNKVYNDNKHIVNRVFIDGYKNKPCVDCDMTFNYICMDFDHINPHNKLGSIASIVLRSQKYIFNEIQKCELVCANCHRIRTHKNVCEKLDNIQKRNRAIIDTFKNIPCVDCKMIFPLVCMDFDHLIPETKHICIAQMLHFCVEKLLIEIQKCELVCANCHRLREYHRRNIKNII